jgi:hypothetical protein
MTTPNTLDIQQNLPATDEDILRAATSYARAFPRTMHVSIRDVCFPASSVAGRLTDNVSSWHTFPLRCAAAIASGYRITFVVPMMRPARVFMTLSRSLSR